MQLPAVLRVYQQAGERLFREGKIKHVEFSGGTYQIQIVDEERHREVWTFLQLDKRNRLKDSFCSCDDSEDPTACPHLAAAYFYIFHHAHQPLHKRFERSLWNKLCFLSSKQIPLREDTLKASSKGRYAIRSSDGKLLFFMQGMTKEMRSFLNDLLFNRRQETEETSLKFSNLSQEEIRLWKEGKPSTQLRYELSFWSDLAKWMMFKQDAGEKYEIHFEYTEKGVPHYIHIEFSELSCTFYIAESQLPFLIPSLATVHAPLSVFAMGTGRSTIITYDKDEGCFHIDSKKLRTAKEKQEGIQLGNWLFVPSQGFYPLDPLGLLAAKTIKGEQIPQALDQHLTFFKEHLKGTVIHEQPIKASYKVHFDKQWNLHIECYVNLLGDLSRPQSQLLDHWAYIEDEGFYKLEDPLFEDVKTIIPHKKVSDFVQQNRTWLNTHKEFETHLTSLESQLSYRMEGDNGPLVFESMTNRETKNSKDFGSWIYIIGEGFYPKMTSRVGVMVRPGISLNADQIPLFIRDHEEELKGISGFFSDKCPVTHAGLDVVLDKNQQILVLPKYEFQPGYNHHNVKFFDLFTYVKGEGFSELSAGCRLPFNYRNPVRIPSEVQSFFIHHELKQLEPFITSIDTRLKASKELKLSLQSIKSDPANEGSYTLKLEYESEHGNVPLSQLWTAIKKKQEFGFSEAGLIDFADKRYDWLRQLAKKRLDSRDNTLTLSTMELIRLNALDKIEAREGEGWKESTRLLQELSEFKTPSEPVLKGLKSALRPYQQIGLHWLWFLYNHHLSGLLCDDMGLGKTHQAMALLTAVKNVQAKEKKAHFLIVCPTSVIYHWQDKLNQNLPGMRVSTFYGSGRSLEDFQEKYDILLTSFGIWRLEYKQLSKIPFEVAIFDEIQIAKNHHSRLYATLTHAKARIRLGMTGTPIENNLRELKSLFDLVLPSYLPGEKDYREYFIKPTGLDHDSKRKSLLSRLIHPFVLRRKKEDVLIDLPEKTEEISHCDLSEDQTVMYNTILERSRKSVLEELEHRDQPIPYIHVFAILSYLKQICDHPACYLKKPDEYKNYQSGKWDLFVELLEEARESRQKVVVFSQYLNMLDIIQNYLEESGIGYATIRGATANRGEQLKRFNEDPSCEVFIGSLQAAGLGVELTAASVVIHYDRWWNAARENQATDRVHRSGQTRGVQVFKMVTKGSFEEKIDTMIMRKSKLMEDVIGVDDHRLLKHFNREEIIELLSFTMR